MTILRRLLLVLASLTLAACGDDAGPIPAVCDVTPGFLDFGQVLAPLQSYETEVVDLNFTVINQVYTNSDRGNGDLAGRVSIQGPSGPGNGPEISFVPALKDSAFLLQPRDGNTYTIRATVHSDTDAGTYSGTISLGTECSTIPFVVRVYVREDTPPVFAAQIGRYGVEEGTFNRPTNLDVDANGWLYVLEDNNPRLQIFDDTWTFWRAWDHLRDIDGRPVENTYFSRPTDIEVDHQGRLHVCDIARTRVFYFERDSFYLKDWGSYLKPPSNAFGTPYSLAVASDGHVIVLDSKNAEVLEFDISQLQPQILVRRWGSEGSAPGQFGTVSDIEIDSQGNIYLSDWEHNAIHKFSRTGRFLTRWGKPGTFIGEFDRPLGLGIDSDDNVYVCDSRNARVQKFDAEGRFLTLWGKRGIGPAQFGLPYDVAVDPNGRIFVTDAGNHRVVVYQVLDATAAAAGR